MAKKQKQLEKLKTAKIITWVELVSSLSFLGFQQVEAEGSRVQFIGVKENEVLVLHKPYPQKEVKFYILKRLRTVLKLWGYI